MRGICDNCKWCASRGCNEHESQTGPYVPPPRLPSTDNDTPRTEAGKRFIEEWYATGRKASLAAVLAIEAEATAAAEQRLRERIAPLANVPHDDQHPCTACRRDGALALLDAPPPASPRQGEPVALDVERLARAIAMVNFGYHDVGTATRLMAEQIAAAYAALSTDPAEPVAPDKETP